VGTQHDFDHRSCKWGNVMTRDGAASRRLALLDRDGTIIVDKVYLNDPDGVEFARGAIEGLRLLRDAGFVLAVVTNQSGVARGFFDAATLERIHDRLRSLLAAEGLHLEAIYTCPHGPEDKCDCLKPASGMVFKAMRELGFCPDETVLIGDSNADMQAAAAAGVAGIRLAPAGQSMVAGAALDFLEAARRARALLADRNIGASACT
jgi:D-glycero-D-manno-heptose 1,7-bisphosphate phosphatase